MPRAAGKVLAPRLPTIHRAIQPEIAVQERAGRARLDARGRGSRSVSGEAHSRHKGQTQTLAALGARSRCHSDDAAGPERGRVGLNHMAWMMESLDDLKEAYARLKALDVKIDAVVDHGLSLGIYFRDPDVLAPAQKCHRARASPL